MTDWHDEIAAVNAITRSAVRDLIDSGQADDPAAFEAIFDESRVDFGKADLPDPIAELGKAVLALAAREQVFNVTVPPAQVTATPPAITVNVPKAEPVVNVKAAMPSELKITGLPERVTARTVERDKKGNIVRTLDVESDG